LTFVSTQLILKLQIRTEEMHDSMSLIYYAEHEVPSGQYNRKKITTYTWHARKKTSGLNILENDRTSLVNFYFIAN